MLAATGRDICRAADIDRAWLRVYLLSFVIKRYKYDCGIAKLPIHFDLSWIRQTPTSTDFLLAFHRCHQAPVCSTQSIHRLHWYSLFRDPKIRIDSRQAKLAAKMIPKRAHFVVVAISLKILIRDGARLILSVLRERMHLCRRIDSKGIFLLHCRRCTYGAKWLLSWYYCRTSMKELCLVILEV